MADLAEQTTSFTTLEDVALPLFEDGSCCVCGGVDNEDLILLCDNPGCKRETHMYCIWPALSTVPEGEWLCDKCDPFGSTAFLLQYLESTQNHRSYMQLTNADEYRDYIQALSLPLDRFVPSISQSVSSEIDFGAECLLGKKVSLFCPRDQRTHTGRILARRHCPVLDQWEHLVLFRSGLEGRNKPLTVWIDLQEHDCLVLLEMGWIKQRHGLLGWWPAQRCVRSARCFYRHHPDSSSPLTVPFYLFVERKVQLIRSNEIQFETWEARTYPRSALARAHYTEYLQAVLEKEEQTRLQSILSNREFVSTEDLESWMLLVDAHAIPADLSYLPQRFPPMRSEDRDALADQFVGTGYEDIAHRLLRESQTWWRLRETAVSTRHALSTGEEVAADVSLGEDLDGWRHESKESVKVDEVISGAMERTEKEIEEKDPHKSPSPSPSPSPSSAPPCSSQLVGLHPFLLDPLALTAHPVSLVQWGADPSPLLPSHVLQLSTASLSDIVQQPIQQWYQVQLQQQEEEFLLKKKRRYELIQQTKTHNKRVRQEREERRKQLVRERLQEGRERSAMAAAEAEMRSLLESQWGVSPSGNEARGEKTGGEDSQRRARPVEVLALDYSDVLMVKDRYIEVRRSGRLRHRHDSPPSSWQASEGKEVAPVAEEAAAPIGEHREGRASTAAVEEGKEGVQVDEAEEEEEESEAAWSASDASSVLHGAEPLPRERSQPPRRAKSQAMASGDTSHSPLSPAHSPLHSPSPPPLTVVEKEREDVSYFAEESGPDVDLLASSSSDEASLEGHQTTRRLLERDTPLDVLEPFGTGGMPSRDIRPARFQRPSRTVLLEVLPPTSRSPRPSHPSLPPPPPPPPPPAPSSSSSHPPPPLGAVKRMSRGGGREGVPTGGMAAEGAGMESHKTASREGGDAASKGVVPTADVQSVRTIKKKVVVGESSSSSSSPSSSSSSSSWRASGRTDGPPHRLSSQAAPRPSIAKGAHWHSSQRVQGPSPRSPVSTAPTQTAPRPVHGLPPPRGEGVHPAGLRFGRGRDSSSSRPSNWDRRDVPVESCRVMVTEPRPRGLLPPRRSTESKDSGRFSVRSGPLGNMPHGLSSCARPVGSPVDPRRLRLPRLQSQQTDVVVVVQEEAQRREGEREEVDDVQAFLQSFQAQHGSGLSMTHAGQYPNDSVDAAALADGRPVLPVAVHATGQRAQDDAASYSLSYDPGCVDIHTAYCEETEGAGPEDYSLSAMYPGHLSASYGVYASLSSAESHPDDFLQASASELGHGQSSCGDVSSERGPYPPGTYREGYATDYAGEYGVSESYIDGNPAGYARVTFAGPYSGERVEDCYASHHLVCAADNTLSRGDQADAGGFYVADARDFSHAQHHEPQQYDGMEMSPGRYEGTWSDGLGGIQLADNRAGMSCGSSYSVPSYPTSEEATEEQQGVPPPSLGSMFEWSANMDEMSAARAARQQQLQHPQQQHRHGHPHRQGTRFGKNNGMGGEIILSLGGEESSHAQSFSTEDLNNTSASARQAAFLNSHPGHHEEDGEVNDDGEMQLPFSRFPPTNVMQTERPYSADEDVQWSASQAVGAMPFGGAQHMGETNDASPPPVYFPAQPVYHPESGAMNSNAQHFVHCPPPHAQQQKQQHRMPAKRGRPPKQHKAFKSQSHAQTPAMPKMGRAYQPPSSIQPAAASSKVQSTGQKESSAEMEDGEVDG